MKKFLSVSVLLAFVGASAFAGGLGFRLSGGGGLISGGDFNKHLTTINDSMPTATPKFKPMNMGFGFTAELVYDFTESLSVGLGTGYLTASKKTDFAGGIMTQSFDVKVNAIPVTLNLHYRMPLGSALKLHLFGGPGLYLSTVDYQETTNVILAAVDRTFKPDMKPAFGAQGGLGLELGLSPVAALTFDVLGRYAGVSDLKGAHKADGYLLIWPFHVNETASMWAYDSDSTTFFFFGETAPTGSGYTNVRKASFSLSGISAQLGILFHF